MELIHTFKNIVIFSGAGVSTNSGIPDYRSENGIFTNSKLKELMFSRNYINEHPEILESPEYLQFIDSFKQAQPTDAHKLAKYLHDRGTLCRVYTQNVDGLYQKAGLPEDKIVEFHGSIQKNIVYYGDPIPNKALEQVKKDLINNVEFIDCIIVMGSSLQVAPFCALPNMVNKHCFRILVDIKPELCYRNEWTDIPEVQGMYSSPGQVSYTKIGNRKVSLKSFWKSRGKWKNQFVYKMDCDKFSNQVMMGEEKYMGEAELFSHSDLSDESSDLDLT